VRLGLAVLAALTAAITAVTLAVPVTALAATPRAVAEGKLWLLLTSGLVAADPIALSIAGFAAVGAAALWLTGPRTTLVSGLVGHVGSALVVYGLLAAAHDEAAGDRIDNGTSDVIAAWLGAIAVVVWSRRSPRLAVALCTVAAAVGWACEGRLSVLDWEHAVSLAIGVTAATAQNHLSALGAWPGRSR
jgi:hypothetical protein